MLDLGHYDRVVSHIYEAALVPAHWDIALTAMMDLFGPRDWHVGFIVWERLDPPAGRFIGSTGVHPLAQDAYLLHFAGRHEWSRRGHDMRLGQVVLSDELIAREAFRETSFYRNFLGPWGYELAILGMLDRHGSDHMGLVCPGPPDVDASLLKEAVRRLTPHVQRAARISRRIGEADMRAQTATDLLDSSPYAVIALGPDLELLMANNRGQALLDRGGGLSAVQGQLRVADGATRASLAAMAAGTGKERSITFTAAARDGAEIVMTALSIARNQGEQFSNRAGGAALMLVGGQRVDLSDSLMETLQQSFDLTKAEARLAAFLLQGSGVKGYVADRGVSQDAGKYLLKSIYAKTGLSNQTELVALLREAPLGWGERLPAPMPSP
jgi:DNA-binding CsgD family transcriptional regulator/PAS domain-containing protein